MSAAQCDKTICDSDCSSSLLVVSQFVFAIKRGVSALTSASLPTKATDCYWKLFLLLHGRRFGPSDVTHVLHSRDHSNEL